MNAAPTRSRLGRLALALALVLLAAPGRAEPPGPALPGRSRIGLEVQPMTPELRRHFEAPSDRGLLVTRVAPGRPAERAGVRVGDVLLEAGGEPLARSYDLVRVVGRAPAGEGLPLRLLRDGEARTLSVVPEGPSAPWPDPGAWADWLERGMQMGSEELREQLRELERRLEQLERRLEEERLRREGAERT
jgi:membrane-associated protease RseP (regulator of RpoE activity)